MELAAMPILAAEPSWFPDQLFDEPAPPPDSDRVWWVLHTKPRQEKSLARQLCMAAVPFYLPLITQRTRVRGRTQTSHVPLFGSYVFLQGTHEERLTALTTNRVVQSLDVKDQAGLWRDLRQLQRLIGSGAPVTPEDRLAPGMSVEITSGPLAGLKGRILRTANGRRFVVAVDFIQQGASILLDDFVLVRSE
jgi:transcription antitermination factor NusG